MVAVLQRGKARAHPVQLCEENMIIIIIRLAGERVNDMQQSSPFFILFFSSRPSKMLVYLTEIAPRPLFLVTYLCPTHTHSGCQSFTLLSTRRASVCVHSHLPVSSFWAARLGSVSVVMKK